MPINRDQTLRCDKPRVTQLDNDELSLLPHGFSSATQDTYNSQLQLSACQDVYFPRVGLWNGDGMATVLMSFGWWFQLWLWVNSQYPPFYGWVVMIHCHIVCFPF